MPSFKGRLFRDGKPVSPWLTFNYTATQSGNYKAHPGTFDLPEGLYVELGLYTVELQGGASCSILVEATPDSSHGRRYAEFNINGRPPA
jgi:hypothetical protein